MKGNLELERDDIRIHPDMEVDCDMGQQITAYIETWFDTARKFPAAAQLQDGEWLNMYAKYDPFTDTLRIECELCRENGSTWFDYIPTEAESRLIKDMVTEKIREVHGQTPKQFCKSIQPEAESVFVYENRSVFSPEKVIERGLQIRQHCEDYGYLQGGSISYPAPMCRSGSEFGWMMDYYRSREISKILVSSHHDIGGTPAEVQNTVNTLCGNGFQVEVVDSGLTYSPKQEAVQERDLADINRQIAPFDISKCEDGEYSLSLRFSFFKGAYAEYGRDAFNRYAVRNGEPVRDSFGFYTHGSGYEWEEVFREAFRDRDISALKFDSEAGSFFCYSSDLSMLASLTEEFKAICEDPERFNSLVCSALDRGAEEEMKAWDMSM